MPAVDDPFSVAASLPGQMAALARVVKDLSVNRTSSPAGLAVGATGLTVGGPTALSSTLSVAGATTLTGGVAGPVAATGALSGASVAATGALSGASVAVTGAASSATSSTTGNASVGGTLAVTGGIGSPSVYSNNVAGTAGNRAVWMDGSGNLGYNISSRRFKEQIETAQIDYATLMRVRVVWFKYIQSIELYGDELAERQLGAIAEEIHDLGLVWMVDYDEDGAPFGLKQERFGLIGILLAQQQHQMIVKLQSDVARLFAVNPTA